MSSTSSATVSDEVRWLLAHPDFKERPATVIEFLGKDYLNIEDRVRQSIKVELNNIIGDVVDGVRITREHMAIFTGAIGIGKTTLASIILPYCVHWVLCLKDPQAFFDLLPGSRIAFMQMSTSEQQARDVVFGDIKARIDFSPWFKKHTPNPKFTKTLKFENEIWIIPGDSAETSFEGYNILGGILDEADSHKLTKDKDYAEVGFNTIENRVTSRFQDRGFVLVIGQSKSATGFAARKYTEFRRRSDAYAKRMTIWESMGDSFYADELGETKKFTYDVKRHQIVPEGLADFVSASEDQILRIPTMYLQDFVNKPEKALKDLAGIPPQVGDPFISQVDRIEACRDRWLDNHPGFTSPVDQYGNLEDWFQCHDPLKRAVHVDIAYAADGDALGIAMGHVREMVEIDRELKPYIVIDMLMRMTAPAGGEIYLSDMRKVIYDLKDERKFRIIIATLDGFQSQDTLQQFHKRKLVAEYLSLDRLKLPYEDLRDAIYERRIEFPQLMVRYERGDIELVEIAVKELSELVDAGRKIDHPVDGSKDIADAMAGVCTTLMGDRTFRRRGNPLGSTPDAQPVSSGLGSSFKHPAINGDFGLVAPLPPRSPGWSR